MNEITIIGIDQSTKVTGVALIGFDAAGKPTRHASASFDAARAHAAVRASLAVRYKEQTGQRLPRENADRARLNRLRLTREWMAAWLRTNEAMSVDAVAYEEPNMRGAGATGGIHQAIGAYLTLGFFTGMEVVRVHATTVKAVIMGGGGWFRAAGSNGSAAEKGKMVHWANDALALGGTPNDSGSQAEADACGVAAGAWRNIQKAEAGTAPKAKRAARTPKEKV